MKKQGEWWAHPIFFPAWWALDRALDAVFYAWQAWDKNSQRWEKR